jgi:hypothetical protein
MEVSMKRLMISTFATIALIAAATTMLLSHSTAIATSRPFVTAVAGSPESGRRQQAPDSGV